MKIKPLFNNILIKPLTPESTIKGIIIPESAQQKQSQGTIEALGNGDLILTSALQVGDKVLYQKYAGEPYNIDKVEYQLMDVSDLTAKLIEE